MRIVQLKHPEHGRKIALANEEELQVCRGFDTVYACAQAAAQRGESLVEVVASLKSGEILNYESIYCGDSDWRILPPFDHPEEPSRCMVSGTGLTHSKGAKNRDAMHNDGKNETLTDSMKIYQWGEEGGKPEAGEIGVQPEWFYKGDGTILRAQNEPLILPNFADDGGEEPEAVGLYLIDAEGTPRRIGFAIGNEFSDHRMERKNYLYLAPSKLRNCAVGPELVADADFRVITGVVKILRNGEVIWEHPIASGEANMTHTLANLEYHHFKYDSHRRPGDVHIHFFGTGAFSFGAGIALQEGDKMRVQLDGFGRPLVNPLQIDRSEKRWFGAKPL